MSDGTKRPTSTEFSVLVLITFFTKNRYSWISHTNLAICDEAQVKFIQVLQLICACFFMSCNDCLKQQLLLNFSLLL